MVNFRLSAIVLYSIYYHKWVKSMRNENRLVTTTDDRLEIFDKQHIIDTLLRETKIDLEAAKVVAHNVDYQLKDSGIQKPSAPLIREMVNVELASQGWESLRAQHTRVGLPVFNISNLIENGSFDNANMIHNPETVHKHVADEALKEYALVHVIPRRLADLHMSGDIHIHDLEFFASRPLNCLQHDLREFIKYGLKVDGTGEHTSVAGAPKHLETLMNHSGEIMLSAQQHMSGGQSMALWNVFAAPFAAGRSEEEIHQAMQMFIFNLNMAYAARGSQVPFTSLSLEFTVPKFLSDYPAYGPGGKVVGTYADFEEETRQIQRAFTQALHEGDKYGKPHLFPNTIYSLRKEMMGAEFDEDFRAVADLMAKFGTPYFANMMTSYRGKTPMADYMGCRTGLNSDWTGDWEQDVLRTGNASYITINLPRLSYANKFNGGDDALFSHLNELLDASAEIMLMRYEHSLKCLNDYNYLPFLKQDNGEGSYYRIENATLSFGFVGLNEMLLHHTGYGLGESADVDRLGIKILEAMNDKAAELSSETGLRFSVLQTPAESTAHRFAKLDLEQYHVAKKYVQGTKSAPYYSNSSHTPVNSNYLLPQRIKIEEKFHRLTRGGHIFHAWMGESYPDVDALANLSKKIATKSDIGFWAYSSVLSFCLTCKRLTKGKQETCPHCGSLDVEWYDRVTGYVQQIGRRKDSVGGWNAGKQQEFKERSRIDL